jgi:signal transduction histidine kinase
VARRLFSWLLVWLAALGADSTGACPSEPIRLDTGHFELTALGAPAPLSERGGAEISLPDGWGSSRPGTGGVGWYRLRIELDPHAGACALRLPEVNANAAVFVNGVWIGQGGSLEEPVAHNFNRPLLFPFASELLHPGSNIIDVSLRAFADGVGRLGPIWLGPYAKLAPVHQRDTRLRTGVAQIATAIAWLAVLLVAALWLAMRRDAAYGWFVVAVGAWGIASLNFWLRAPPLPHWTWDRLVNSALDVAVIGLAIWVRRFFGLAGHGAERSLLALGAVMLGAVWLAPRSVYPQVVLGTHGLALLAGAWTALLIIRQRKRLLAAERWVYIAAAVTALLLAARDFSLAVESAYTGPPTLPVAFTLTVAAFAMSLLLRFSGALNEVGQLNASLETRVRAREAEIAHNFERLRELEHRAVLTRERERIMRDLHDGLGGQLVSALGRVEGPGIHDPETAAVLRDALAEMRMVIDSLDPEVSDLPSMLAHVRERLEPSLGAAGIRLRWAIEDVPEEFALGSDGLLQVVRMVQEAITNVVRHAAARTVTVGLRVTSAESGEECLELTVEDDGSGLPESPQPGRGLKNMRARAEGLGGTLEFERLGPGTRVRLRLPPNRPQSPSSSSPRFAAS